MSNPKSKAGHQGPAGPAGLAGLATEGVNPRTGGLDQLSTLALVRTLQREDGAVAAAVRRCVPAIAQALDAMAPRFEQGGRLIYVGAGSSGRLGALDAAECPPTFGVAPRQVVAVIAGGRRALTRSVEGAEDRPELARRDLARLRLRARDIVVGIAASGRTPYTVAALAYARAQGCLTVAVACVPDSALAAAAAVAIEAITGPEALTGSTRLKAGTAQKMILNLLSTGLMVRSGRVLGNLMVAVQPTNAKLRDRAERILMAAAGWQGPQARPRARRLLRRAGDDLRQAIQLARGGCAPRGTGAPPPGLPLVGGPSDPGRGEVARLVRRLPPAERRPSDSLDSTPRSARRSDDSAVAAKRPRRTP